MVNEYNTPFIPMTPEEEAACFTDESVQKAKDFLWSKIDENNRGLMCVVANAENQRIHREDGSIKIELRFV